MNKSKLTVTLEFDSFKELINSNTLSTSKKIDYIFTEMLKGEVSKEDFLEFLRMIKNGDGTPLLGNKDFNRPNSIGTPNWNGPYICSSNLETFKNIPTLTREQIVGL